MDVFRVISPGPMTTIQDLGRLAFLDRGVPVSGALDSFSCRIANILVGNPEDLALLEMTIVGACLEVLCEADIALAGASMAMQINGNIAEQWCSCRVKAGDIVSIGTIKTGCRGYLAVTGGIDVPLIMGSRSTYVRAKIGGFAGRPLKKGDVLRKGPGELLRQPRRLPAELVPSYQPETVLRVLPGPQDDAFRASMDVLLSSLYEVTTQSDRMGCRLKGPALERDAGAPRSIVTEPTVPGNIQVPEDGLPIILLVEQTTGGYTKIATVITADLPAAAQLLPGNKILFEKVDLEKAHALYRQGEADLKRIKDSF